MIRNVISLHDLTIGYGYPPVLEDVNVEIYGGEWVHVAGSNGEGKSTLLKVIATLKKPLSGTITWNDEVLTGVTREDYRRKVRYFGHDRALFQDLSVRDNWNLFSGLFDLTGYTNTQFASVGSENTDVRSLSQGEKQRTELATFWPTVKPVMILDEPYASLDSSSRKSLKEFLSSCCEEESMVITASTGTIDGPDRQFNISGTNLAHTT